VDITRAEGLVPKSHEPEAWVVYTMDPLGKTPGIMFVCTQNEWDAMELARPGHHTLVRSGITNEGEAERLARGTSGDPKPRIPRSS
jgi:hypothetical protein